MKNLFLGLLLVAGWLATSTSSSAYYDPETGTFITRDPAGMIDGPNEYTYVKQNPWTHFDPEGLYEDVGDGIGIRTDPSGHKIIMINGPQDTTGIHTPLQRDVTEAVINHNDAKSVAVTNRDLNEVSGGDPLVKAYAITGAIEYVNDPEGSAKFAAAFTAGAGQMGAKSGGMGISPEMVGAINASNKQATAETEPTQSAQQTKAQAVNLQLTYKDGWTPEQKAAADAKAAALTSTPGKVTTPSPTRSSSSASSRYPGAVPSGSDVDHTHDLQLGGKDDVSNMAPLDSSVNRSMGAQINNQVRKLPPNTPVDKVTITDKNKQ